MKNLCFISYYTKDTLYEKDAMRLKASCENFGLEHCIEGIDSFGKWHQHTLFKPTFILNKLLTLKKPLVWVDADAEIVKQPLFFSTLKAPLSFRIFDHWPEGHPCRVYDGTVYFDYCPEVIDFVQEWHQICESAVKEGTVTNDQHVFGLLLLKTNIPFIPLPKGYATIFDEPDGEKERYIVHYQASRLYKKIIDGEMAFNVLQDLSIEELRELRPKLL